MVLDIINNSIIITDVDVNEEQIDKIYKHILKFSDIKDRIDIIEKIASLGYTYNAVNHLIDIYEIDEEYIINVIKSLCNISSDSDILKIFDYCIKNEPLKLISFKNINFKR